MAKNTAAASYDCIRIRFRQLTDCCNASAHTNSAINDQIHTTRTEISTKRSRQPPWTASPNPNGELWSAGRHWLRQRWSSDNRSASEFMDGQKSSRRQSLNSRCKAKKNIHNKSNNNKNQWQPTHQQTDWSTNPTNLPTQLKRCRCFYTNHRWCSPLFAHEKMRSRLEEVVLCWMVFGAV